jgi:hypothetical protein
MFGWRGRLLRVNLSKNAVVSEPLDLKIARRHLGGRGLGAYFHAEEVPVATAPLSAENHLIFATGPLTGTLAPNGGRYTVVTRSLLSGEITASSISGKWGPELKFAGFDAIIFEGAAEKPVYLWIKDGEAELRSAEHLSGKTISAATDALLQETDPKAIVSCIGPAGENEVNCSIIANDYFSAAGGNGTGAVMGAKKLKAVVVRGTKGFRVADRERLLKTSMDLRSCMKDKPIRAKGTTAFDAVLYADSLAWDSTPQGVKPARTRGCFSCATSFSAFESDGGKAYLPLLGGNPPSELAERLKDYRLFVDYGLDFNAARTFLSSRENEGNLGFEELAQKLAGGAEIKTSGFRSDNPNIDRGPCFAAGYAIAPRLAAGNGHDDGLRDLMAVLDSVGLCPFLAAGISMETIAELLSAATGIAFTLEELTQAGQRISWSF